MAGHFYPLPPANIGGRQPYAPPLGLVQSGPTPSAPPPVSRASLRIIEARYREDPWTILYVCRIAPLLSTPAVPDNPPTRTHVNLRVISGQWEPAPRPLPYTIKVAPFVPAAAVPDNPPRFSYANRNVILASWVPPYRPIPQLQISEIVTEVASDTTPDQFTFADRFNVATSTVITSDPITVTGIDAAADITVSGGEYSINGGSFVSTAGTVVNGDLVQARHTSSGSASTATNTAVTIGGVLDIFTSTTAGAANPSETGIISIIVRRNRLLQ